MDQLKTQDKFKTVTEITSLTSSFMPAKIVLTANRLDLFSKLASKKLSAKDLASVLQTDVRATEYLCNALTALGFLEKENDQYQNSPKADEFLVKGRPYYVGDNLRHQALLSNIIHMISLEDILFLLKKVRSSLNQKGRVVIKDFYVNEDRTGPVFATQFAINMLVNTDKGNTYTFSEINQTFSESGFVWINSFEVGQNSSVIVGEKID